MDGAVKFILWCFILITVARCAVHDDKAFVKCLEKQSLETCQHTLQRGK